MDGAHRGLRGAGRRDDAPRGAGAGRRPDRGLTAATIVVAGRTAPNRAVRFGGEHDRLDDRGRRDVAALTVPIVRGAGGVCRGPETSVRESCEALGLRAALEPALASLDVGDWRGRTPEQVGPAALAAWFADPDARPHGGETVREFVARIAAVPIVPGAVLVVASPVAQALLCGSAADFFATPVIPGSIRGTGLS